MSKKQLGAAPGEENAPEAGLGWFGRLRAQPGFRTAAVAFLLTVVLGIGGTAAYAWWSLTKPLSISGSTGYNLPVPSAARCITATPNRVEWSAVSGAAETDARYILTFQAQGRTVYYAVPFTETRVEPVNLDRLYSTFGNTWGQEVPLTVTVQTGIVSPSAASQRVVPVTEDQILQRSALSAPLNMYYHTFRVNFWANYPCS